MTGTAFLNTFSDSAIRESLSRLGNLGGTIEIETSCLYPSFEPVMVNIEPCSRGFKVHDNGQAERLAWLHGKNEKQARKVISNATKEFLLEEKNGEIFIFVENLEWMKSSILAVANCSAKALETIMAKKEAFLESSIAELLDDQVRNLGIQDLFSISKGHTLVGSSGKAHHFDIILNSKTSEAKVLVNSVTAHHASIAHRFTAFADLVNSGHSKSRNIAVFQDEMGTSDKSLMLQVASLVPLQSVSKDTFIGLS